MRIRDRSSNGETIPMIFLVASGIPFNLLIGCDILRIYAAVIDMSRAKLSPNSGDIRWTAELIESRKAHPDHIIYYIREDHNQRGQISTNEGIHQNKGDTLWIEKLNEIKRFQSARVDRNLTNEQIAKLIKIYNRYRHVFSDTPGTVSYTHLDVYKRQVYNCQLIGI